MHIFARTAEHQVYRIHPAARIPDRAVEAELLERLLPDCEKHARGELRVLKEHLLTLGRREALAMADFLQQVRTAIDRIYSRDLTKP